MRADGEGSGGRGVAGGEGSGDGGGEGSRNGGGEGSGGASGLRRRSLATAEEGGTAGNTSSLLGVLEPTTVFTFLIELNFLHPQPFQMLVGGA